VRILVVDDHRNTRDAIALGLAALGADVETAASGADALKTLTTRPCEWIVTDLRMPGMSGIDLATRVRAVSPDAHVVLMTAYDVAPDERLRIAELGAELLIKPVTAQVLVARCRGHSAVRAHRAGADATGEP
jgi:DNA-binding response OmpR family regulator